MFLKQSEYKRQSKEAKNLVAVLEAKNKAKEYYQSTFTSFFEKNGDFVDETKVNTTHKEAKNNSLELVRIILINIIF